MKIGNPSPDWVLPPKDPTLEDREIHVWRALLDVKESQRNDLLRTLSAEERQRTERFRFQRDREHFVTSRGFLRAVLARYLRTEPKRIRFRESRYGKPEIEEKGSWAPLQFSVSHSQGLALYAVACRRNVGVDVEKVRSVDHAKIAGRFFSRGEISALLALPSELQREAFYDCWTRKEAFVKARGEGLSLGLNQFEVSLGPGQECSLLKTAWDEAEPARWSIRALRPSPGYAGAIAFEGKGMEIRYWQLQCE
jgi:4'-phosphopantetheinyl transferase